MEKKPKTVMNFANVLANVDKFLRENYGMRICLSRAVKFYAYQGKLKARFSITQLER